MKDLEKEAEELISLYFPQTLGLETKYYAIRCAIISVEREIKLIEDMGKQAKLHLDSGYNAVNFIPYCQKALNLKTELLTILKNKL